MLSLYFYIQSNVNGPVQLNMKSDIYLSVTGIRIWITVAHIQKKKSIFTKWAFATWWVRDFVYLPNDAFHCDLVQWRAAVRTRLYTSKLWHIWLNRKMHTCILHLEYLCIFKNYLWYLSTVAVTFFTFPCRRFIEGAQSGLSVSSSELGLPLKNKFTILQADFKSYLKEILCNIALEVWNFF